MPKPSVAVEAGFQQQIVDLARLQGWRTYHTYDSRRSNPGWPDLALWRGAVLLFMEVKSDKGRVTEDQERTIRELEQIKRVHADIVRPADFDQVAQVLKAKPLW